MSLEWTLQPADPGARRAESGWTGRPGTAADIATELRQWPMIRFEVTEEPSAGVDGERYMHVPGRGLHRSTMGAAGDIQIGEDHLRQLMTQARSPEAFAVAVERALGSAWDAELEPYRWAGDGAPVTLLTRAS
ncbi:hypothetical protein F4553_002957 [Allocatelliglobosispora scoriae]|uniref:DUF3145 domain-containing protein n=1 Tax=Allocatelliglobosispora scoriae TaxID=643052 RepID=A0A841BQC2_9ACTN|nr:hypothetical protein [Allocatelliglobosispora scoriae]